MGKLSGRRTKQDTVPDAHELSRTQKCLNKIGGFPNAGPIVLGDARAWLTRQREKLELAKRLRELSGTDITHLAQEARRRNPAVAIQLTRLLIAEALCLNPLPAAPSESLIILGKPGIIPLQNLLQEDVPLAVHVLAAMTLGAISRTDPAAHLVTLNSPQKHIDRAFRWAREHGFPQESTLMATLIAEADAETGIVLAGRFLSASKGSSTVGLPTILLREMLADGVATTTIVEFAEVTQSAEPIAERLLKIRQELSHLKIMKNRQVVSEARRAQRQQIIESLAEMFTAYARSSKNPLVLRLMTAFIHKMLDLCDRMTPHSEAAAAILEQMLEVIRMGLDLPPFLHQAYWEILLARYEVIWDRSAFPDGDKPDREMNRIQGWLRDVQSHQVLPLCKSLAITQDQAIVLAAFDGGITQYLVKQEWTDSEFYRLFVRLAVSFGSNPGYDLFRLLSQVLNTFTDAHEARSYFQSLLAPLQAVPISTRIHVIENVFSEAGYTRQAVQDNVPRLMPFLTSLTQFADKHDGEWCLCGPIIETVLALVQSVPDQTQARLNWLLCFLRDQPKSKEHTYEQFQSLRTGLMLATSLTAEDADHFQQAVRTATQHHFRQDPERIKGGLRFVECFPTLRSPLANLFVQQPQRIAEILVRLGLTTRLGIDVHPLLEQLKPQSIQDFTVGTHFPIFLCPNNGWWHIHQQMPEFTETANAYLHAQWMLGESQDIPPGIRRILDKPQRIATELGHLDRLLTDSPDRTDLASRAKKLRGLLADKPRLAEEIRLEMSERLPHITAITQVAAIEHQVLTCYRTRLEAIAGPLPAGMVMTDDLINATLLSVEITQNRKLLLRLIRAHLSGEHDWREKHLANKAFLMLLAERGVDTNVWLSKYARRYPCEHAPGKWVHLSLELDPLHILQMGNYFDTCLSYGGFNAFSTVANACELNKRVIYARDHAGNVIGRKLIGINENGELIGFHTYGSLLDDESNSALRHIFQIYATAFAQRCSLPIASTGTIPTLFAENWYDDGTVEWDSEAHSYAGKAPKTRYNRAFNSPLQFTRS